MKARFVAGTAALISGALLMFAPLLIFRSLAGIPLDASGPSWEIWLLIFSGALGAGIARFVHHRVMTQIFCATDEDEETAWRG